VERKIEKC